jgi:hypothetical protein
VARPGILGLAGEPGDGTPRTAEVAAQIGVAALSVVTNVILLVAMGLFLATAPATYHPATYHPATYHPATYHDAFVKLIPIRRRPRAEQILTRLGLHGGCSGSSCRCRCLEWRRRLVSGCFSCRSGCR